MIRISKTKLLEIMFKTFSTLDVDMEIYQAMWDGLISDANFRFVDEIDDWDLKELCDNHFDGNVRECFYYYINNIAAGSSLETFIAHAEAFIEKRPDPLKNIFPDYNQTFGKIFNASNTAA